MTTLQLDTITAVRDELLQHPIYKAMQSPERVRIFMEHHVFAVWDFMSLLKRLQQDLTCTHVPWIPVKQANYARFINEIVLGEETDEDGNGGYTSHFDLYLDAMEECGANTEPIKQFIAELVKGTEPLAALHKVGVPESVFAFVERTLELAKHGGTHEVCASFFFGREDLIPSMFQVLVDELVAKGEAADRLVYYLNRHIELDGDEHGPLAEKLLASLCDNDAQKLAEAEKTAMAALQARIKLWDGVLAEIGEE